MNTETKVLSLEEQSEVNGGVNWSCFAAGALIMGGLLTAQPEAIAVGIFGASTSC